MKDRKIYKIRQTARGTLYAVIITLVLVLLFAVVIRLTGLGNTTIGIVSQVIKVLSIFYGVRIALRDIDKRGYLWGGIVGLLYTAFAFFIFSVLVTSFAPVQGFLFDTLFAVVVGILSALILKMGRREYY